jgi:hypothetical protein
MRGRQQTYRWATSLQLLQLGTTVLTPAVAAIVAVNVPEARPYLAALSLALLLLDVMFLDRAQLRFIKQAAKIAELFDHEVLELPWNDFVAGGKLDPEDIQAAAASYPTDQKSLAAIKDWYPPAVGKAPLFIARIACQLTNLRYDATLRRRYADWVMALPVIIAIVIAVSWASLNLSFSDVVLSLLAPASPIMVWALRERFRHKDTATGQEAVKQAAESLWSRVTTCSDAECTAKAREFQDAIYQRRVSSPLIFPAVYHALRDEMEEQMNRGAEERLSQIGF